MTDPQVRALYDRARVFLLLYVDAASFIDDDPAWDCYFLFASAASSPRLVGLATVFNFFSPWDRVRQRISQFLILPHYQRQSHGLRLLRILYSQARSVPNLRDITVEDASTDFQIIRHIVDLEDCRAAGFLDQPVTPELEQRIEGQLKLYKIRRVLECWALSTASEERPFRLACKARLFKVNRELFDAVKDTEKQKEILAEFYQEQIAEYRFSLLKLGLPVPTWVAAAISSLPQSEKDNPTDPTDPSSHQYAHVPPSPAPNPIPDPTQN